MAEDTSFSSSRAPEAVGAFPHARRAGHLLFLSGIGPRTRGTPEIPADFETQCRTVLANVRTVLEDAGSSWDRIVDVTAFLTHMERDFPTWNRLWREHFPDNPPARTTVEVTRLPTPIDIELKVIATI